MSIISEIRENLISEVMEVHRDELNKNADFVKANKRLDILNEQLKKCMKHDRKIQKIYAELQDCEVTISVIIESEMYKKGMLMGNKIDKVINATRLSTINIQK